MRDDFDTYAKPEFLLACACCRWPLSPGQLERVSSLSKAHHDWNRFLRTVTRHRITGLVHAALTAAHVHPPPDISHCLAEEARGIALQNIRLAAEAIRLRQLFDAAEISALFVKGVTLSVLAYGSLLLKHGKDIDLLVPRDRALDALSILEKNGYDLWLPAPSLDAVQRDVMVRYTMEAALIHHTTGAQVELHWSLTKNPLLLQGVDAMSQTQEIPLSSGHSARTLSDDDLFAYLCVHGGVHAWSRLKWLADIRAFLARSPAADFERLYRYADERGVGLCAGQGLLLCEKLLGLPLPNNLREGLQRRKGLQRLTRIALDALTGSHDDAEIWDRPFGGTRITLSQFFLSGNWRYLTAQFRIVLVSFSDMLDYPLPRFLHGLYPILRVPLWFYRLVRNRGRVILPPPLPR